MRERGGELTLPPPASRDSEGERGELTLPPPASRDSEGEGGGGGADLVEGDDGAFVGELVEDGPASVNEFIRYGAGGEEGWLSALVDCKPAFFEDLLGFKCLG